MKEEERDINIPNYLLIIPILIFLISRFLPFYLHGPHPLGYDTGFYNYHIEKERTIVLEKGFFNFASFSNLAEVESWGERIIIRLLIALGFSNWMILYLFYILAGALAGFLVYILSRLYFGKMAAFFSALIYSISLTQFMAYWEMFWKNAVGLSLMLLVFYLVEQKKLKNYIISFILAALIFITHKTTAFILFTSLLIYFLIKEKKYRIHLVILLFITAIPAIWLNRNLIIYLWEQISSGFKAHYDFFSVREGIFIDWPDFFKYSFFYLPFGVLTALQLLFKKKNNAVLILFFVSFLFILIKFIFYRRLFIFLDISLIVLSGFSLYRLAAKLFSTFSRRLTIAFTVVLFFALSFIFFLNVAKQKPLLGREEIKEIENMKEVMPQAKIFTYDSYYTPWLYGFSGHKIIAPGWGDLKWDLEKWEIFWKAGSEEKKKMLSEFGQPILVYAQDNFFSVEKDPCFKGVKNNFYLFNCESSDFLRD